MPSVLEFALRPMSESLFAEPYVLWDEKAEPHHNLNESIETALRARRIALTLEHRDLDLSISVLAEASASDELLIARLKKRRLNLKDEIARIEGHLPA